MTGAGAATDGACIASSTALASSKPSGCLYSSKLLGTRRKAHRQGIQQLLVAGGRDVRRVGELEADPLEVDEASSKSGRDRSGVTLSSMPPTAERTGAVWKRGSSPGAAGSCRPCRRLAGATPARRSRVRVEELQLLGGVVVLARELALDTDGEIQVRRPFALLIFLQVQPRRARPVRRSSVSAKRSWASVVTHPAASAGNVSAVRAWARM